MAFGVLGPKADGRKTAILWRADWSKSFSTMYVPIDYRLQQHTLRTATIIRARITMVVGVSQNMTPTTA
jgi:hypothetical protein